jgi:hypothetical protein
MIIALLLVTKFPQQFMTNSFDTNNNSNMLLINDLKKQNLKAFSKLYDVYAPTFYAEIKRNLYQQEASDQTLMNVFTQICNSVPQFDPAKERFFTWCFKIVRKEIGKKKVDLLLKQIFACQKPTLEMDIRLAQLS